MCYEAKASCCVCPGRQARKVEDEEEWKVLAKSSAICYFYPS